MTSKDVDIVWEIIRIALDREESIAQTYEIWANRPTNDKNYDLLTFDETLSLILLS
jgi:hypothetical protein